jgi:hypothetical protein
MLYVTIFSVSSGAGFSVAAGSVAAIGVASCGELPMDVHAESRATAIRIAVPKKRRAMYLI